MKKQDSNIFYLVGHLAKTIDFPSFIETETGTRLKYSGEFKASCHCPMPDHKDSNASFRLKRNEDNNEWIYNCFGCNSKGTIVHFCKDYYGLRNKYEAIQFLCKKFNIKNKEDLILNALKNVTKKVNVQRKVESVNIVASNQCRLLLRKDFKKHSKWVSQAYKEMNEAIDEEDYDKLETIGYDASRRMREV